MNPFALRKVTAIIATMPVDTTTPSSVAKLYAQQGKDSLQRSRKLRKTGAECVSVRRIFLGSERSKNCHGSSKREVIQGQGYVAGQARELSGFRKRPPGDA